MRHSLTIIPPVFGSIYDAASTTPERDFGPFSGLATEDSAFTDAVRWLAISRIRREVRNNPYLAGLVAKLPESIGSSSMRSRTGNREYDMAKEAWWYRLTKRIGSVGQSLRTIEGVFWPEMAICGEVFFVKLADGTLQMIPSEFCGSTRYYIDNPDGTKERNGIGYDKAGRPTYYRFGRATDWGSISFADGDVTIVPAAKVIHVFRRDRVHMGRGLPWLLPSIATARDLYEITRAKTKQIKDVTSFMGYVKKTSPNTAGLPGLTGARGLTDAPATPESATDPADRQSATNEPLRIQPGFLAEMDEGESIESLMTNYNASDYKELIMLMLHAISTPIGLPVELWFSGLGDVNYSGFKGLGAQWAGRRKEYILMEEELFLDPFVSWRTEYAHATRELPRASVDETLLDWRWKRATILDDDKQAASTQKRLDSGESCISDIWEENGLYAEEELAKRRALYITMLHVSGDLPMEDDGATVKVPLAFLIKNEIMPATEGAASAPSADEVASAVVDKQQEQK